MLKKRYELRPIKNVCIYARYSPGSRQTDQSIEGQYRICEQYAKEKGWRVVKTYADRHKTGTNDDREQFRQMIKDSDRHLFDAVLVWKNDRFGRNMEDMVVNEIRIKKNGVSLVSATEPVVEGAMGAMQKAMLMGMAEFYSATNSENVRRGLHESALKCQVTSAAIPFGYKKGDDKKFHLEPAAAAMVKEIFERYDNGELIFHIMDDVNARGFKTWQGNPFTRNSMYTVLRNERYTGVYIFKDIKIEGGMPKIIDKDIFERVQIKLKKNKHAPARAKAAEPFLLTTKCFCGYCGGNMVGESGTSKNGEKHYYYCCVKRKNARVKKDACQKKSIRKELLEKIVIDKTLNYVLSDKVIHQIAVELVEYQRQEKSTLILDSLLANRRQVEKAINNLLTLVERGDLTEALSARLRDRENELEAINIAIAEQEIVHEQFTEEQIVEYISSFKDLASDLDGCQRLIDMFIKAVFVYADKVVICYNFTGDDSKLTVEDIEKALSEAEENPQNEKEAPTEKAPVPGGSCSVNASIDNIIACSDNVGLVHSSVLNPNTFIYLPRSFGLVINMQDMTVKGGGR